MMRWALALMVALAACACTGPEKSVYMATTPDGWPYDMAVVLEPDPADSLGVAEADVAVAVRHTSGYEYSNIWVELSYADPDGLVHADTVNIPLADVYGNWHGRGVGVGYQRIDTVLHRRAIDLSQPIAVRHLMRVDTLADIEQVGLVVVL